MENDNENENFIKKKRLIMRVNSGELNRKLLYYINEARTAPKDFSRHLMVDDDVDEKISKLSLFFKYSSNEVGPLIPDKNFQKSSQELLYHIISIDDGSPSFNFTREEKERNCLRERLKRLNLIPTYYVDLLIVGVEDPIEALSNILLNRAHRNKILSPEMQYIGISSGFLPSERLCFVIDIVHSFQIRSNYIYPKAFGYRPNKYNYKCSQMRYNDYKDNYNEEYYRNNFMKTQNNYYDYDDSNNDRTFYGFKPNYNRSEKRIINQRKYFNSTGVSPPMNGNNNDLENGRYKDNSRNINKGIDLRISKQTSISPLNGIEYKNEIYSYRPKAYKIPLCVSIEKNFAKNKKGQVFPIYSKQSKYDDGSILIQPYDDDQYNEEN